MVIQVHAQILSCEKEWRKQDLTSVIRSITRRFPYRSIIYKLRAQGNRRYLIVAKAISSEDPSPLIVIFGLVLFFNQVRWQSIIVQVYTLADVIMI